MSTPSVAAVIVSYNAGEELRRALQSVVDECGTSGWEAVVVDNASADDSVAVAESFAPAVRVIRNARNVGFGAGINQGLAATTAPLVLIMNPDCRLVAGAIAGMTAALLRHDHCAIVGPRILNPDGSVQGSARGDPDMLTGFFGRSAALRRLLPGLSVSKRNVVSVTEIAAGETAVVDWLSGACMLARREALEAVRGFDEGYFLYWEDADLCRRLRAAGYHVRYVPSTTAVHRVGESSRSARAASIRAFHESAYRYYATHVAPSSLDPRRPLARLLLAVRRAIALRAARG
ncbi:MAG: glycosyltransferase family 2 protein [Vicinamibacterales bacterium]